MVNFKHTEEVQDLYNSLSESSSYIKELNTGPIGPLEPAFGASLLSSPLLFCQQYIKGKMVTTIVKMRRMQFLVEKKDYDLTVPDPIAHEGYNVVTMSIYFSIASSGGIAPNFCHACLYQSK